MTGQIFSTFPFKSKDLFPWFNFLFICFDDAGNFWLILEVDAYTINMEKSEGRVSYSSLSKVEKENTNFHYIDDYGDSGWVLPEDKSTCPSGSRSLGQEYPHQYPLESEEFLEGGYDSGEDCYSYSGKQNMPPEVNLKNVLTGIVAIVTGRNKDSGLDAVQQFASSNVSFLGSAKNGETFLHSSVYIPSAPPLLEPNGINYSAYKDVLEAEPPEWLPDSSTTVCMQCTAPFTPFTRGRHHCRFCGGIFCRICSKGRCLLPVKFRERNPQRVCDTCYDRLDPLQGVLINTISNAVQVAKHDVMDWTSARCWLNLPVGLSMEHEIYKSSNTLRSYCQVLFTLFQRITAFVRYPPISVSKFFLSHARTHTHTHTST